MEKTFQNPTCHPRYDTKSLDTSFETTVSLFTGAEMGWGRTFQIVSETVVFEMDLRRADRVNYGVPDFGRLEGRADFWRSINRRKCFLNVETIAG